MTDTICRDMQCNIDSRGKRMRLVSGLVEIASALVLAAAWAWPSRSPLAWIVVILLLLGGAFSIFEAWAGWCALRAMGIKTRI
jgi:hypothetical protein